MMQDAHGRELWVENTIGPYGVTMTNINTAMALPGHAHFAEVWLTYRAPADDRVFPAFERTSAIIHAEVTKLFSRPFRGYTNENVAVHTFQHFAVFAHEDIAKWGGNYELARVDLDVQGVHDHIGHAAAKTRYSVGIK